MAHEDEQTNELPQVLVLEPPSVFSCLESQFPNRFHFLKPWLSKLTLTQFLTSYAQSVRALLCRGGGVKLTSPILDCLPSLKLVVTSSVGVDHLDLLELRRRGVAIAYAGNLFSQDVADMAVGFSEDFLN